MSKQLWTFSAPVMLSCTKYIALELVHTKAHSVSYTRSAMSSSSTKSFESALAVALLGVIYLYKFRPCAFCWNVLLERRSTEAERGVCKNSGKKLPLKVFSYWIKFRTENFPSSRSSSVWFLKFKHWNVEKCTLWTHHALSLRALRWFKLNPKGTNLYRGTFSNWARYKAVTKSIPSTMPSQ